MAIKTIRLFMLDSLSSGIGRTPSTILTAFYQNAAEDANSNREQDNQTRPKARSGTTGSPMIVSYSPVYAATSISPCSSMS